MTEQERAAALAGAVSHTADVYTLIDGGFAIYFNKAEWSTIEAALRLLAATPAAPSVVPDKMVEAACLSLFGSSYDGREKLGMRAALEAALKVKEPTNDRP